MIEELMELARVRSSENRRELMGRIADHFIEGSEQYNNRELKLFGDVMTRLLCDADVETRAGLSSNIASVVKTPRKLSLHLAKDEIEVARPVLEKSFSLTDADLAGLAKDQTIEHRLAISKRPALDETVTDVLIEKGEMDVLRSVSGNKGARISDKGFSSLAVHAPDDGEIHDNLSTRKDMSLDAARNVLPVLRPEAQQMLLSVMQEDQGALAALVKKAARETSTIKKSKEKQRFGTKIIISEIRSGERQLDDAIKLLANENRPMDCALVLSIFSGIPESQIANAMLKVNGELISLVCRSQEISTATFTEVANMRCKRLHLPLSQGERLVALYSKIDPAIALRTLRFVKVRNSVSSNNSTT